MIALAQQSDKPASNVTPVETALNHLTVLEFHEPVTMAAAGSSDFEIERQDNKVFVKPTKPGVSTDLLVWTKSHRFAYELQTTPEVKTMNFAIDAAIPVSPAVVSSNADQLADMMLTRAFLGAIAIHSRVRAQHDKVGIRVEQVFRTRSTIYVHYAISNDAESPYHLDIPAAFELKPEHSPISLASFAHTQIDEQVLRKLGPVEALPLSVAHSECERDELESGSSTEGVIAIRQDLKSPAMVQLVFGSVVKAVFVL